MTYVCPTKIYKYLDVNGLIKTLEGRSLKFSRPSDFNDPFDIYLEEALGSGNLEFLEGIKSAFYNFFMSDFSNESIKRSHYKDTPPDFLINLKGAIRSASPEQQKKLMTDFLNTPIQQMYDLEKIYQSTNEVKNIISKSFLNDGVFCSTVDQNNLLMWAHYAEKHKGAVIELMPDLENDSVLLASKPVLYSNKRPLLYRNPEDMVLHGFTMTAQESIARVLDGLVYTKSLEWAYEKEYRCYIPKLIPENKDFHLINFYPWELVSVYMGCKMESDIKSKVINLVKEINSTAKIYQAETVNREYNLRFKEVA